MNRPIFLHHALQPVMSDQLRPCHDSSCCPPKARSRRLEGHVQATADDVAAFRLPATVPWYGRMAVDTCCNNERKNDTFCSQRKQQQADECDRDAMPVSTYLDLCLLRCIFRRRRRRAKHTHVIVHCIAEDDDDNSLLLHPNPNHLPIPVHPVHDPLHPGPPSGHPAAPNPKARAGRRRRQCRSTAGGDHPAPDGRRTARRCPSTTPPGHRVGFALLQPAAASSPSAAAADVAGERSRDTGSRGCRG